MPIDTLKTYYLYCIQIGKIKVFFNPLHFVSRCGDLAHVRPYVYLCCYDMCISFSILSNQVWMVGRCVENVKHTDHRDHTIVEYAADVYVKWIIIVRGKLS